MLDRLLQVSAREFAIHVEKTQILGRHWGQVFNAQAVAHAWQAACAQRGQGETVRSVIDDKCAAMLDGSEQAQERVSETLRLNIDRLAWTAVGAFDKAEANLFAGKSMDSLLVDGVHLGDIMDELCVRWAAWHKVSAQWISTARRETMVDGIQVLETTNTWHTRYEDGEQRDVASAAVHYAFCQVSTDEWRGVMGDALDRVWRKGLQPLAEGDDSLSFDATEIVLALSNGRYMSLSSSEWAGASALVDSQQGTA